MDRLAEMEKMRSELRDVKKTLQIESEGRQALENKLDLIIQNLSDLKGDHSTSKKRKKSDSSDEAQPTILSSLRPLNGKIYRNVI